ncbi:unnamed protein product [Sympodiomycopsis kandeliae]
MCGIYCLVQAEESPLPEYHESLEQVCSRRGPHCLRTQRISFRSDSITNAYLTSSVLSLRGQGLTAQPIRSHDSHLSLAWNGQVYSVTVNHSSSRRKATTSQTARDALLAGENDGQILMDWLNAALDDYASSISSRSRALSMALDEVLSSIEAEWAMVLVDSVTGTAYYGRDPIGRRSLLLGPSEAGPSPSPSLLLTSTASQEVLSSGFEFKEVDCTGIWAYSIQDGQTVKLHDRSSTRAVLKELRNVSGSTSDQFPEPSQRERDAAVECVHSALLESVRERVTTVQGKTSQESSTATPSIAILFSGGLDCTLLAYFSHLCLPISEPIDLINVAFENPRVLQASSQEEKYNTPDRMLCRKTLTELQTVCPGRRWNLVEVDVTFQEYSKYNQEIQSIMNPNDSIMDLSLASVLFFASRGQGHLSGTDEDYNTSARVYISGLGADELFGGYSRHRKAFDSQSLTSSDGNWPALVSELQLDLDRLHTRNLGRDDRILSHFAREARYPFLCTSFIDMVSSLDVRTKAELTLPLGMGEKYLLRFLAIKLGLVNTASEKKRAMQFGARSAKMEVGMGKTKGHQRLTKNADKNISNSSHSNTDKNSNNSSHSNTDKNSNNNIYNNTDKNSNSGTGRNSHSRSKSDKKSKSSNSSHNLKGPLRQEDRPINGAASSAPAEIFTTLCYYPQAPRQGQRFPVQLLLPDDLRASYSDQLSKSPSSSSSSLIHPLDAHIPLLGSHVRRLQTACQAIESGYPDDWSKEYRSSRKQALNDTNLLDTLSSTLSSFSTSEIDKDRPRRVRLAMSHTGEITITQALLPVSSSTAPLKTVRIDTRPTTLPPDAKSKALLLNKTSSRAVYDTARERVNATMGLSSLPGHTSEPCFDVLMWSCNGQLTESSIANILVQEEDGQLYTPALKERNDEVVFLPGVMRDHLLHVGLVEEREDLTMDSLKTGNKKVYLCNALRGVMQVEIVP